MQINQVPKQLACASRVAGLLGFASLAAVCMLVQAPARAAGSYGEGGATKAAGPTAAFQQAKTAAEPNAKLGSRSPYAAWRAQREQAEKPDTSGHGHRAPRPEGQGRSRRLPQ
jgi:hypothetical protein